MTDQSARMRVVERFVDHGAPIAFRDLCARVLDEQHNYLILDLDKTTHLGRNLGELLAHKVDCNAVGQLIASQIGGFGASALSTACSAGLVAGAGVVYSKIDAIDASAFEFGLTGTAKALDKNGDHKIDTIQTGQWAGDLNYAGTPAPLAAATFYGERM